MTTLFTMLGASFLLTFLLMLGLWLIYLFSRNAAIVDIGWGIGFIMCAWAYFFIGDGNLFKMLVITLMVTAWGGRLTKHLVQRYQRDRLEDPRYRSLRVRWGKNAEPLFLMLFIFQAALIVVLSAPFLLVARGSHAAWSGYEVSGFLVWLIGLTGEAFADAQLAAFKKDPKNTGQICRQGLWHYSRHPNYFFEEVVWVGFALFAFPSDWGGLALASPIIMWTLLVKVSGIPMAESQSLLSKGELYREYQKTTSAFIPWFPKN